MKRPYTILSVITLAAGLLLPVLCFSQLSNYQFEEMDRLQSNQPRNLVVFIHTDWCAWCKATENILFKNKTITRELNTSFYFISFNAEDNRTIDFAGRRFRYKPGGKNTGIHELAEALGTINGKVTYPSIVILNPANEILFQYNQFINATALAEILKKLRAVKK